MVHSDIHRNGCFDGVGHYQRTKHRGGERRHSPREGRIDGNRKVSFYGMIGTLDVKANRTGTVYAVVIVFMIRLGVYVNT
jgi:hypothetical protein